MDIPYDPSSMVSPVHRRRGTRRPRYDLGSDRRRSSGSGSPPSVTQHILGEDDENHRKTIGKWWFNGILWDFSSGND